MVEKTNTKKLILVVSFELHIFVLNIKYIQNNIFLFNETAPN